MKRALSDIIIEASKQPNKQEKIRVLREVLPMPGRLILKYTIDENCKFLLPEGAPPYKPSEFDEPGNLYAEVRRIYLFVEGGNPNLKPLRREQLYVQMLEAVTPNDAKLLIDMVSKKLPKGLTADIIREAFPDMFTTPK